MGSIYWIIAYYPNLKIFISSKEIQIVEFINVIMMHIFNILEPFLNFNGTPLKSIINPALKTDPNYFALENICLLDYYFH